MGYPTTVDGIYGGYDQADLRENEDGPEQVGVKPVGEVVDTVDEEVVHEGVGHQQDECGVGEDVDGVGDGGPGDVPHADVEVVEGGLEFAAAGRGHEVWGELPAGGPDPYADAEGEAQDAAEDLRGQWGHAQEGLAGMEGRVRSGAAPCVVYFESDHEDADDQRGDVYGGGVVLPVVFPGFRGPVVHGGFEGLVADAVPVDAGEPVGQVADGFVAPPCGTAGVPVQCRLCPAADGVLPSVAAGEAANPAGAQEPGDGVVWPFPGQEADLVLGEGDQVGVGVWSVADTDLGQGGVAAGDHAGAAGGAAHGADPARVPWAGGLFGWLHVLSDQADHQPVLSQPVEQSGAPAGPGYRGGPVGQDDQRSQGQDLPGPGPDDSEAPPPHVPLEGLQAQAPRQKVGRQDMVHQPPRPPRIERHHRKQPDQHRPEEQHTDQQIQHQCIIPIPPRFLSGSRNRPSLPVPFRCDRYQSCDIPRCRHRSPPLSDERERGGMDLILYQ